MTENEFKFCAITLYNNYKGKTLNEIIKTNDKLIKVRIENIIFEKQGNVTRMKNTKDNQSIIYYNFKKLRINGFISANNYNYDTVESFLKAINVKIEDIV